jgi:lipopolysaccharide transport protein LptA
MKQISFFLALASFALIALAQNDSVDPAAASAPAPAQTNITEIFSDRAEFLMKTNLAVYTGNVRVIDPRLNLKCEILTIRIPKDGGRPDYILAEKNVVIDTKDKEGKVMHATSDKAVYTFDVENMVTNEVIVLSGNPMLSSETFTGTGDPITWDLAKGAVYAAGGIHMTLQTPVRSQATNPPASTLSETNTP